MSLKKEFVGDALWQLFFVVGYHNHGFVMALAESLDDVFNQSAVDIVKAVQRLIENKQFGVFYESSG